MTQWLYLTDSYLKTFSASVTHVGPLGVVLESSAFYPGGGSQSPDHGFVEDTGGNRFAVTGSKREDDRTWLLLEGDERPAIGAEIKGTLDWDRRYGLMRIHTALHMLSAIVWRDYQARVTGGNMEPFEGRLDFELSEGSQGFAEEIEAKMNEEVAMERPISVDILSREEAFHTPDLIRTKTNLLPEGIQEIRTINIQGLDLQADGGTHVANTREVGNVRVAKYRSKGKGNKRLYIELDRNAD